MRESERREGEGGGERGEGRREEREILKHSN